MLSLLAGIGARIFSNSYLNVCQKLLTNNGENPSVVNLYMYIGAALIGVLFCPNPIINNELILPVLIMGLLSALGNYFIIKALSCGELSTLAPINSYKPVVALIFGIFLLNEIPGVIEILGILLIIIGTFVLINQKFTPGKAYLYRFLALIFSAADAIFIKKVILLSNISSAFLYWAVAGLIFSLLFTVKISCKIRKENIITQLLLIFMFALMQYSTNFVFSKMNVAYALALFQLSTLVSVFLGVNIFKEEGLVRKIIASLIMITGAVIIIL